MENYGKILKAKQNNFFKTDLLLLENLSAHGTYYDLMKKKYDEGYTQVIINSLLMLQIAENMIIDDWILLKIEIDDPGIDSDEEEQIKILVESLRKNVLNFNKLTKYLEWILDEGSILIDKIVLGKKTEKKVFRTEISSKGILVGDANTEVYNEYLRTIIEDFLNVK